MLILLGQLAPGVTLRGFRASFKTWANDATSVHPDVVETALAHKIVGDNIERAYRRGDFFEKRRELMASWSAYLNGDSAGPVR